MVSNTYLSFSASSCSEGRYDIGTKCIQFSPCSAKTYNWYDALDYCHGINADLMEFSSDEEFNKTRELALNELAKTRRYFWIGAIETSSWNWVTSNTSLSENATYWAPRQPDNQNQRCAWLYGDGEDGYKMLLDDFWCDRTSSYGVFGLPLCQIIK